MDWLGRCAAWWDARRPKRVALLFLLPLVLILAPNRHAAAQVHGKICRVSDATDAPRNLRNAPNGRLIGKLQIGALLEIITTSGSWVQVGRFGYDAGVKSVGWTLIDILSCYSEDVSDQRDDHEEFNSPGLQGIFGPIYCGMDHCTWARIDNKAISKRNSIGTLFKVVETNWTSEHPNGRYEKFAPLRDARTTTGFVLCSRLKPTVIYAPDADRWVADRLAFGQEDRIYHGIQPSYALYFAVCHGLRLTEPLEFVVAGRQLGYDASLADPEQVEISLPDEVLQGVIDCEKAYEQKRFRDAELCWRSKAQAGDLEAQFRLGKLYYQGAQQVPTDKKQAAAWFTTAAERGHVLAQGFLGLMYLNGIGVTQSSQSAIKWYEAAAKGGDLSAAQNLAFQFKKGTLSDRDAERALYWCNYFVDRQKKSDLSMEFDDGCDKWLNR
jgi:TPR repeat protein